MWTGWMQGRDNEGRKEREKGKERERDLKRKRSERVKRLSLKQTQREGALQSESE